MLRHPGRGGLALKWAGGCRGFSKQGKAPDWVALGARRFDVFAEALSNV